MAARPESGRDKRVCVAQIGAAHGLKGEVRLWSFTEVPDAVARYGVLETEDGKVRVEIESLRAAKDYFVAKLSGIGDRNAAEALRNVKLYVRRDRLPKTEDETFYHADLIGLTALTTEGEELGQIVAIQNFGAGDILEIRLRDGTTTMLPFTETAVPKVDVASGKIVVDPPEGTFTASSRPSAAKRRASRDP